MYVVIDLYIYTFIKIFTVLSYTFLVIKSSSSIVGLQTITTITTETQRI